LLLLAGLLALQLLRCLKPSHIQRGSFMENTEKQLLTILYIDDEEINLNLFILMKIKQSDFSLLILI